MANADDPVLLDNCAISAVVEMGCWDAIAGKRRLETVEEVEREAGTGFQHHRGLDPRLLRQHVTIHAVSAADRLGRETEFAELAGLDDGELDLWVHALGRTDGWVLCGPDTASVRFGVRAGHADRLISIEELLASVGYKHAKPLKVHYTRKWLEQKISEFKLELAFEKAAKR